VRGSCIVQLQTDNAGAPSGTLVSINASASRYPGGLTSRCRWPRDRRGGRLPGWLRHGLPDGLTWTVVTGVDIAFQVLR
jgi:hypothetical protein